MRGERWETSVGAGDGKWELKGGGSADWEGGGGRWRQPFAVAVPHAKWSRKSCAADIASQGGSGAGAMLRDCGSMNMLQGDSTFVCRSCFQRWCSVHLRRFCMVLLSMLM